MDNFHADMSEISYPPIHPRVETHEKRSLYIHQLTLLIISSYKTGPTPVSTTAKFLTTNLPVDSSGNRSVAGGVKYVRLSRLRGGGWEVRREELGTAVREPWMATTLEVRSSSSRQWGLMGSQGGALDLTGKTGGGWSVEVGHGIPPDDLSPT